MSNPPFTLVPIPLVVTVPEQDGQLIDELMDMSRDTYVKLTNELLHALKNDFNKYSRMISEICKRIPPLQSLFVFVEDRPVPRVSTIDAVVIACIDFTLVVPVDALDEELRLVTEDKWILLRQALYRALIHATYSEIRSIAMYSKQTAAQLIAELMAVADQYVLMVRSIPDQETVPIRRLRNVLEKVLDACVEMLKMKKDIVNYLRKLGEKQEEEIAKLWGVM